jgi:hypothetical protein
LGLKRIGYSDADSLKTLPTLESLYWSSKRDYLHHVTVYKISPIDQRLSLVRYDGLSKAGDNKEAGTNAAKASYKRTNEPEPK